MKKVIFIEPKPPDLHVYARMALPRLGTIMLATKLNNNGYESMTYVEQCADLDLADALTADYIGLSTITSTSKRAYEMAKIFKEAGIPVFMGGPHVTFMPDEGLEYCDYVLRGEADDNIVAFMKALETGIGLDDIKGLSYRRKDGRIMHNAEIPLCRDIDTLPCPDFKLIGGLEKKGSKSFTITPVMTSRGCPYDCSFCSVTSMFGQKYRFRKKELVLEELRNNKELGSNWVFFYDDNFIANRSRTKELLSTMIEKKLTPNWTAQLRVEVGKDPELLDLMRRSNCHTVYIGFESVNPKTLELYNKKQSVDDIEYCIKQLHKYKIRIHGMFVLGSDTDTVKTIRETVRFAKKNDIETVQFLILTPLPGTRTYNELEKEGRIISKDWSLYDAHHVVFEPKLMSYYELQNETFKATREFYSIPQILKRAIRFDVFNVGLKTYGRGVAKTWKQKNKYFFDYTKAITDAGSVIELAAKKTAEDLKDKFRKIQHSGASAHQKT